MSVTARQQEVVKAMQTAGEAGVLEMDKFIAEVRHSAADVEKISSQLGLIIAQMQALSPRFEEGSMAMGHQSENARQINVMKSHGFK